MNRDRVSSWLEKARLYARILYRLRSGTIRLRSAWWQVLQTAVAAGIAYFLAVLLLPGPPEFAPIAAVISLGLTVGQRGRRAVELTVGVAFGVVIVDLVVSLLGVGAWQSAILVALAMSVAVFLGRGELGVNEAAITAMILMITFRSSGGDGFPPDRFVEALIGGGTALLINAVLPINPERMVEKAAHPIFEKSVMVLEELAISLDEGDSQRTQDAYLKAREIDGQVSGFKEAVAAGRETARLAPSRRRTLGHLDLYASAADQIDLVVRDVRALTRAALSVVREDEPTPSALSAAVRDLALATETLDAYLRTSGDPEDTRNFALQAAAGATSLLREHQDSKENLAVNAFVDQIHSSAVDILGGTGMTREAALKSLNEAENEKQ